MAMPTVEVISETASAMRAISSPVSRLPLVTMSNRAAPISLARRAACSISERLLSGYSAAPVAWRADCAQNLQSSPHRPDLAFMMLQSSMPSPASLCRTESARLSRSASGNASSAPISARSIPPSLAKERLESHPMLRPCRPARKRVADARRRRTRNGTFGPKSGTEFATSVSWIKLRATEFKGSDLRKRIKMVSVLYVSLYHYLSWNFDLGTVSRRARSIRRGEANVLNHDMCE